MIKRASWTEEDQAILLRAAERGHIMVVACMRQGDIADAHIMDEREYNRVLDAQQHSYYISEEEPYI